MDGAWRPQSPRDELVLAAMESVRAFGESMDRMHGGVRDDMDMNATDVAALRMLVVRERRGEWVSPHEIAAQLSISTASTTKLLDRLSERGHVERRPHPHDGRGRIVVLTDLARQEFSTHFGHRMRTMRAAMEDFDDDELRAVIRFMDQVGTSLTD
ncbi:MarR family winged helix-turn-helix transcriptional regulator [Microbacterium flavum]|nr:MarR family transcriptional regulator [Microbacterium flavum]